MWHNPSSRRSWLPPAQRTEEAHGFSTLPSCHLFLHPIALPLRCNGVDPDPEPRGLLSDVHRTMPMPDVGAGHGRGEMWRGGGRPGMSVSAPFVWRCLSGSTMAPFPHPAHRTGHADLSHPSLGQDLTPSPTTGRAQVGSDGRARSARRGTRVDMSRLGVA